MKEKEDGYLVGQKAVMEYTGLPLHKVLALVPKLERKQVVTHGVLPIYAYSKASIDAALHPVVPDVPVAIQNGHTAPLAPPDLHMSEEDMAVAQKLVDSMERLANLTQQSINQTEKNTKEITLLRLDVDRLRRELAGEK